MDPDAAWTAAFDALGACPRNPSGGPEACDSAWAFLLEQGDSTRMSDAVFLTWDLAQRDERYAALHAAVWRLACATHPGRAEMVLKYLEVLDSFGDEL